MKYTFPDNDLLRLWGMPKRLRQSDIPQFIPPTRPGLRFINTQLDMVGSGYQQFLAPNSDRRFLQFQLWEFVGEFVGVIFELGPTIKIELPTTPGYTELIRRAINLNSLAPINFDNPPVDAVTIILKGTPGELVRGMITEGV